VLRSTFAEDRHAQPPPSAAYLRRGVCLLLGFLRCARAVADVLHLSLSDRFSPEKQRIQDKKEGNVLTLLVGDESGCWTETKALTVAAANRR